MRVSLPPKSPARMFESAVTPSDLPFLRSHACRGGRERSWYLQCSQNSAPTSTDSMNRDQTRIPLGASNQGGTEQGPDGNRRNPAAPSPHVRRLRRNSRQAALLRPSSCWRDCEGQHCASTRRQHPNSLHRATTSRQPRSASLRPPPRPLLLPVWRASWLTTLCSRSPATRARHDL